MADLDRATLLARLADAIGTADDREYPDSPLNAEGMAKAALEVVQARFILWGLVD